MQTVETNAVLPQILAAWIGPLQQYTPFAIWSSARSIVRWMTSFDTIADEVNEFAATSDG